MKTFHIGRLRNACTLASFLVLAFTGCASIVIGDHFDQSPRRMYADGQTLLQEGDISCALANTLLSKQKYPGCSFLFELFQLGLEHIEAESDPTAKQEATERLLLPLPEYVDLSYCAKAKALNTIARMPASRPVCRFIELD